VPIVFAHEEVDTLVLRRLKLEAKDRDLSKWNDLVHRVYNPKDVVRIGIVGKYVEYEDSYKSLKEALVHGALAHNLKLEVNWIEAEGWSPPTKPTRVMRRSWKNTTDCWCPADSASAASKACCGRFSTRERSMCPTLESVWECRRLALNMRATSADWRTPTPASSIRRLRIA
jgi:hypothetical protein